VPDTPDFETFRRVSVQQMAVTGVQHPQSDFDAFHAELDPSSSSDEQRSRLTQMVERRTAREPCERILGYASFCGRTFFLEPHSFKPGFETQTTAEHGVLLMQGLGRPARILDMGTGTGCILITLLCELPDATGVGVDLSDETLELARRNAQHQGVLDRARFLKRNWMTDVKGPFDLLISNPPRIRSHDVPLLVREVAEHDPCHTLDGGADGLDFYRRTAQAFRNIAALDGVCVLQVGASYAVEVARMMQRFGYRDVALARDYKQAVNCVVFRNHPLSRARKLWLAARERLRR